MDWSKITFLSPLLPFCCHSEISTLQIHSWFSIPGHGKNCFCSHNFKSYSNMFFFFISQTSEFIRLNVTDWKVFYTFNKCSSPCLHAYVNSLAKRTHGKRKESYRKHLLQTILICQYLLIIHKSWDKIQPTEHLKLNQKVKQTSLRCFLYM